MLRLGIVDGMGIAQMLSFTSSWSCILPTRPSLPFHFHFPFPLTVRICLAFRCPTVFGAHEPPRSLHLNGSLRSLPFPQAKRTKGPTRCGGDVRGRTVDTEHLTYMLGALYGAAPSGTDVGVADIAVCSPREGPRPTPPPTLIVLVIDSPFHRRSVVRL